MNPGTIVNLWTDDAQNGSGWRTFVVVEVGRKWAYLLQPTSLVTHKEDVAELRRFAVPLHPPLATPARTAKIIKKAVKDAKAYSWRYSEIMVDKALALLTPAKQVKEAA